MTETQVWSGRYELVRKLARGGMAEVFLARDLLLDRPVALKVLYPELSRDPTFVERFRREAQAAANLSHPNIVSVYDWGEEDGTYFIVMEFVDGESLASLVHRAGALQADEAAEIGAEIAAALAVAHRGNMVHRDVKPGNVLIDRNGQIKVTDFGIARAVNTTENLTQPGSVMGTATYFSPEQAQGQRIDPRSDVYSLGVVLYELVTGAPPFSADSPVAVAYKHVREDPVLPSRRNPDVPADFERIVLTAMAKNPDDRYANALELRDDLVRFRQGRPVAAAPTYTPAPAPRADRTQAVPVAQQRQGPPPGEVYEAEQSDRRTGVYVALLLGLLTLLALLLFLLGRTLGVFGGETGELVAVPNATAHPQAEAEQIIRDAGLTPQIKEEASAAEKGVVFNQDPVANEKVESGSVVVLFVSRGTPGAEVPDVIGESEAEARRILEEAGFVVSVTEEASRDKPDGTVLTQSPQAGQTAPAGSTVGLVVSSGTPTGEVPDVTNLPEADARRRLEAEGFEVTVDKEESATVESGRVIRTNPEAGSSAELGSSVTIVVSSGAPEPETQKVPDVTGRSEAEAESILNNAGFRVSKRYQTVVRESDDGIVLDQSPEGGREADRGATVTIVVGRLAAGNGDTTTTSTTAEP
ncbi:MAG TPA: Stk1 family PASTA domain-containing Ser/Thr kinase [Acidimicrobiales bacterium]|nr:Stk1 family PASTA domain-containing Ser/Thr kinase [Acidimicrobiales bacterium]